MIFCPRRMKMNVMAAIRYALWGTVLVLGCFGGAVILALQPGIGSEPSYHCATALVSAQRARLLKESAFIAGSPQQAGRCAIMQGAVVYQINYETVCNAAEASCTMLQSIVREDGMTVYSVSRHSAPDRQTTRPTI